MPIDRLASGLKADPREFQPALVRLQELPPSPLGRRMLWATLAFLGGQSMRRCAADRMGTTVSAFQTIASPTLQRAHVDPRSSQA